MDHSKHLEGRSITTSVPSIAVRFHTGDEELELYPSADDEEEEEREDYPLLATASSHTTSPTPPSIPSRDPSPMKEYFKGLGKRSTSVDGAIMDVGSSSGSSDTWRIFHELKGKITKTVEEKLTEMKNERKASTTTPISNKRSRLRAGGMDNSSISDSEDISEASNKEGNNSPTRKDPGEVPSNNKLIRNVNFPITSGEDNVGKVNSTLPVNRTSKDSHEQVVGSPKLKSTKNPFRKNKEKKKGNGNSSSLEEWSSVSESEGSLTVESGVEISEETRFESEEVVSFDNLPVFDYRQATAVSHQPANLARRHSVIVRQQRNWQELCIDNLEYIWEFRNLIVMIVALIVYMCYPISPFINGLIIGIFATVIYHLIVGLNDSETSDAPAAIPFRIPDYLHMPILKVPESTSDDMPLTTAKCSGWMNELPNTTYDPLSYHISDTQTVYINLEGSSLYISHPKSKISKRATFNEKKHKPKFIHQRIYNISGCKLELLPEGLTRKRLWSKKYPICIHLTQESVEGVEDAVIQENGNRKINPVASSSFQELFAKYSDIVVEDDLEHLGDEQPPSAIPSTESIRTIVPTNEDGVEDDDDNVSYFSNTVSNVTSNVNIILKEHSDVEDDTYCLVDKTVLQETKLFLFARADRQKEDWYRRFVAAVKCTPTQTDVPVAPVASKDVKQSSSKGLNKPSEDVCLKDEKSSPSKKSKGSEELAFKDDKLSSKKKELDDISAKEEKLSATRIIKKEAEFSYDTSSSKYGDDNFIMNSAKDMSSTEYLEFMNRFHLEIPRDKMSAKVANALKLEREVDCDVMWLNAIIGHVLFDVLKNPTWTEKVMERIQKKLDSLKLPKFLDFVNLVDINLGKDVPLIHRASRPVLDEHGMWVDLDVSYEGHICLTIETKINLMKFKKVAETVETTEPETEELQSSTSHDNMKSPIFDSDLEDSAESSETEDQSKTSSDDASPKPVEPSPVKKASSKKGVLRIMNKIVESKYFQQATENRYIKRAMEGVSNTVITLAVDIRAVTGILSINLPPPPSDRLWYGFRGNPRLWIKARSKLGDRQVNIRHVANFIEKKLIQEFQKKFVLPNMDDVVIAPMSSKLPE